MTDEELKIMVVNSCKFGNLVLKIAVKNENTFLFTGFRKI